ncbi:MAG TPA: hypothetical protein VGK25_09515 [Ignavibacteria bacterium]|jgi:hypothetical protein
MSSEEEKYKKLRESLRSLPRIKTKNDFDTRLFSRIKDIESGKFVHTTPKTAKENILVTWLSNLFRPSLVPAIGLTVVLLAAIIVYFAYYNQLGKDTQPTQYSVSERKDGFVIYVKKDGERIYDDTAREITSVDQNQPTSTSSDYYAPLDHNTDALSVPDAPKTIDARLKDDEPKIETQRGVDMKTESDEETKIESKTDEGKMMKKGYIEKEEAPSNYERKIEDSSGKTEDKVYDQQVSPNEENKNVDEKQNELGRVAERRKDSKKDSLKAKDKEVEQKDSIEK